MPGVSPSVPPVDVISPTHAAATVPVAVVVPASTPVRATVLMPDGMPAALTNMPAPDVEIVNTAPTMEFLDGAPPSAAK